MENSFFEMALEASRDRRAEERFIKAMEPMVKKVASRFALRVKGASEFKDDMENAARLGIHNALMRFDFSYGGFDNYLEKAMEIEVRTFLNNNLRMIRIPKHMLEAMRKYRNGFNEEEFSSIKVRKIKDAMNVENCLSLDNAINEKCSRIKAAFSDMMDEYQADYYIINSHVKRHQGSYMKLWFERLKIINLPRELVVYQC